MLIYVADAPLTQRYINRVNTWVIAVILMLFSCCCFPVAVILFILLSSCSCDPFLFVLSPSLQKSNEKSKKMKPPEKKTKSTKLAGVNHWSGFGDGIIRVSVSLHFVSLWVRSPWTLTGVGGWFCQAPGFGPIWPWKSWRVALTFLYPWFLVFMLTHTLLVDLQFSYFWYSDFFSFGDHVSMGGPY